MLSIRFFAGYVHLKRPDDLTWLPHTFLKDLPDLGESRPITPAEWDQVKIKLKKSILQAHSHFENSFFQPILLQVYNITQLVLEYFHKKNEYVNYTELAGDFFQTTLSWLTREGRALNPGKMKSST